MTPQKGGVWRPRLRLIEQNLFELIYSVLKLSENPQDMVKHSGKILF